jgi:hypothetical protein
MTTATTRVLLVLALVSGASIASGDDVVHVIRVEMPATVDRNASFQGIVSALNSDHEVVPSYRGTVHFTGTTGVTLPADYTFTEADNGSHTFTFSASRGGHHGVTAADVADPATGSSGSFEVLCPELTVAAGNAGPVCVGANAILYGSSNQSDVTYYWTGVHGWFSTEQNPTTAPGPGTYFLELGNADGCRTFATTTVEAITPPQMTLSGSATQACGGETFTTTVDDSSSYTNFEWEASGATILSGQGTPTVQVQAENLNVLATVYARGVHVATGCNTSAASSYRVDVDPRHPAEITAPSVVCPNATITASVPATFNASYNWSITNGTVTLYLGNAIEFVANGPGEVTVTATVYNNVATTCASTDIAVVTVREEPEIVTPPQNAVIPRGTKTTLSVKAIGAALTYRWYEGQTGDRSHLLSTGTSSRFETPALQRTTRFWVDVIGECGSTESPAATVAVAGRQRSARH